jgi:hypothetical protein
MRFFLILALICFSSCQTTKRANYSQTQNNTEFNKDSSLIIRGIDISNAPPEQQQIILYMETLTQEQAFELLKTFVKGEIVYKTDSTKIK